MWGSLYLDSVQSRLRNGSFFETTFFLCKHFPVFFKVNKTMWPTHCSVKWNKSAANESGPFNGSVLCLSPAVQWLSTGLFWVISWNKAAKSVVFNLFWPMEHLRKKYPMGHFAMLTPHEQKEPPVVHLDHVKNHWVQAIAVKNEMPRIVMRASG